MSELQRSTLDDVDISTEQDLLSFTYLGASPVEVIVRVDLTELSGDGGTYVMHAYIDDVLVVPDSLVSVSAGVPSVIMTSRSIPLDSGDVLKVAVVGQGGDTSVDSVVSVRSATPATISDLTGIGQIVIDEDYGGANNLQVFDPVNTIAVGGAKILIFLKADYDNNLRGDEHIRAQSLSLVDGSWANPARLDPETYIVLVEKAGYRTRKYELVVTA
jgi:hypothetical protein